MSWSLEVSDHIGYHQWRIADRQYDGSGTPLLFSDMAIMTVHEIRQAFRLPLRQCEGIVWII